MMKKSIISRMFIAFTIVIVIVMSFFTVIISNIYWLNWQQNLEYYSDLTLSAVEDTFAYQCSQIKTSIKSMVTYEKSNLDLSIMEIVQNTFELQDIESDKRTSDQNTQYMQYMRYIYDYMEYVQKPLNRDASLLCLIEKDQLSTRITFRQLIQAENEKLLIQSAKNYIDQQKVDNINSSTSYYIPFSTINDTTLYPQNQYYALYDYLRLPENSSEYAGYIILFFNAQEIDQILDTYISERYGDTYIVDANHTVIYSSPGARNELLDPDILCRQDITNYIANRRFYNIQYNDKYEFYVVNVTDISAMYSDIIFQIICICLLCLLFMVAAIVIIKTFTNRILGRIRTISQIMNSVTDQEFPGYIVLSRYHDEIDIISHSFNMMLDKIQQYIQQTYVHELKLKDAAIMQKQSELHVLQSQINPHFLYNSLELLRIEAMEDHANKAAAGIRILGKIFQTRLKQASLITVGEELDYCTNLLRFYSIRFDGELDLQVDVNPDIQKYQIPKDLLQPIIENIIVHAFPANWEDERMISISGYQQQEYLEFIIQDNGVGIPEDALKVLQKRLKCDDNVGSSHIGIANTQRRIHLVYGEDCGLFVSNSNPGCRVVVRIRAMDKI